MVLDRLNHQRNAPRGKKKSKKGKRVNQGNEKRKKGKIINTNKIYAIITSSRGLFFLSIEKLLKVARDIYIPV